MLIQEKIKKTSFTSTEQIVVNYLETHLSQLKKITLREAAKECFTYPSTFIRVAKKLDFKGWNELKEAYLKEIKYIDEGFHNINANHPFNSQDSLMTIARKMSRLTTETIEDTLSMIEQDILEKVSHLIDQSSEIKIFTHHHNGIVAQEFCLRMNRIGQYSSASVLAGDHFFDAAVIRENACAMIISYSGESETIEKLMKFLKKKQVPILLLTSIGDNSLSKLADYVLHITTREKLYSKIGNFSAMSSINHLLNILYASVFSLHYEENYQHLVNISKYTDHRQASIGIIKEE
ncbi:MAG: MurR/RpiR family transcriptional regulator [Lactovum sp.]